MTLDEAFASVKTLHDNDIKLCIETGFKKLNYFGDNEINRDVIKNCILG